MFNSALVRLQARAPSFKLPTVWFGLCWLDPMEDIRALLNAECLQMSGLSLKRAIQGPAQPLSDHALVC